MGRYKLPKKSRKSPKASEESEPSATTQPGGKGPEWQAISFPVLQELVQKTATGTLSEGERAQLMACLETLAWLSAELERGKLSAARLRRMLFGWQSEKQSDLFPDSGKGPEDKPTDPPIPSPEPEGGKGEPSTGEADSGTGGEEKPSTGEASGSTDGEEKRGEKPRGHGRNGAIRYTGAKRCRVSHQSLTRGQVCPECGVGKLYPFGEPSVFVRVTGMSPLSATVYELERLRCNGCGRVFTASVPEGVGLQKYDETVTAMIGLLRYGTGLPFYRLSKLQESMGIPLPSGTAFELAEEGADELETLHEALIEAAANGEVLHNDDTTMKSLDLGALSEAAKEEEDPERTGIFTTGLVSVVGANRIALYFTGRRHAGENLTEVLKRRASGQGPPLQMSDALSRNTSKEFGTIVSNCLVHARRNFVDVLESFPEEVRHVLGELGRVYHHEAEAKAKGLTDEERQRYHLLHSAEVMRGLHDWMKGLLDRHEVEPNSGLGQACKYMLKRWETFTVFLRVPGAPLDNNICERVLKRAILHRRNSLFYKTENGARVGDLWMSLIHTCELTGVNPFEYLVAVLRHNKQVRECPGVWLPWNYRDSLAQAA